jgi:excisionase family DNA binding protein
MATLRGVFPDLGEPVLTVDTAAKALRCTGKAVRALILGGHLSARRWGLHNQWLIPEREIARYKSKPGWFRDDVRWTIFGHLLDHHLFAARSLMPVIDRRDGVSLVPSPTWEKTRYRKGDPIGRVIGFSAGVLHLESLYGPVVVSLDDTQPES